MAREPIKKSIDGRQYTFYQLPPRKSLRLLIRIFKIIGSPLGNAFDNIDPKEKDSILDKNFNLGQVVSGLCDRMDVVEVESIIDELLSQVIQDGTGEVSNHFDEIFSGQIAHLFKVVYASMEAEYSDFFDGKSVLQGFLKRADINQKKAR